MSGINFYKFLFGASQTRLLMQQGGPNNEAQPAKQVAGASNRCPAKRKFCRTRAFPDFQQTKERFCSLSLLWHG